MADIHNARIYIFAKWEVRSHVYEHGRWSPDYCASENLVIEAGAIVCTRCLVRKIVGRDVVLQEIHEFLESAHG